MSNWVFTAMQSVHIRMNSSLRPPLKNPGSAYVFERCTGVQAVRTAAVRTFSDVLIVLHNLDSCGMHRCLGFPSVVLLLEDSSARGVHHQCLVLDETCKIGKGRFKPIFLDCCCVTQPAPLEFEWQAFNNLC